MEVSVICRSDVVLSTTLAVFVIVGSICVVSLENDGSVSVRSLVIYVLVCVRRLSISSVCALIDDVSTIETFLALFVLMSVDDVTDSDGILCVVVLGTKL